jgi:hypothetical protein
MPEFKVVLSTTAKVLLSLVVISAVIALGIGLLGGIAALSNQAATTTKAAAPASDLTAEAADTLPTTMPKSSWDRGIARAIKHHCFTDGMSRDEVVNALGEPTGKSEYAGKIGSSWSYQGAPGKCLRYQGELCVERETHRTIVFFTHNGNVEMESRECQSLNGDYIFTSDLFDRGGWK